MSKKILVAAVFAFSVVPNSLRAEGVAESVPAPVFGWKHTASGLFNLSQGYFDNWTQGGSDALAWEVRLEGGAVLDHADYNWESKAKAVYGQTKVADLDSRKSSDEWTLETIYTRKFNAWINPFAAARGQSQFAPGYTYNDSAHTRTQVSNSFDPTYVTQTLGLGYAWRKEMQLRLGGTLKETFGSEKYGYADDKTTATKVETFKFEPGASFTATYTRGLMENILLSTMLDVFVNFKGWDEVDGRWENTLTAKVNKFVSANFGLSMLYDKDLSESRQIKESLAIGISFLSI